VKNENRVKSILRLIQKQQLTPDFCQAHPTNLFLISLNFVSHLRETLPLSYFWKIEKSYVVTGCQNEDQGRIYSPQYSQATYSRCLSGKQNFP